MLLNQEYSLTAVALLAAWSRADDLADWFQAARFDVVIIYAIGRFYSARLISSACDTLMWRTGDALLPGPAHAYDWTLQVVRLVLATLAHLCQVLTLAVPAGPRSTALLAGLVMRRRPAQRVAPHSVASERSPLDGLPQGSQVTLLRPLLTPSRSSIVSQERQEKPSPITPAVSDPRAAAAAVKQHCPVPCTRLSVRDFLSPRGHWGLTPRTDPEYPCFADGVGLQGDEFYANRVAQAAAITELTAHSSYPANTAVIPIRAQEGQWTRMLTNAERTVLAASLWAFIFVRKPLRCP
jgi:hypothetical protein